MIVRKTLSERDICTKFITPILENAQRDKQALILEEVSFTGCKVYARRKLIAREARKRVSNILYFKPSIPVAITEAKGNNHSIGAGIQQGLVYKKNIDIP